MLDSHVIGLRPGRGATPWPLTPRATSNNMRIQHISISKLDSYNIKTILITIRRTHSVFITVVCIQHFTDSCLHAGEGGRL